MAAAFTLWALLLSPVLAAFPDCVNGPLRNETVCDDTSGEDCLLSYPLTDLTSDHRSSHQGHFLD